MINLAKASLPSTITVEGLPFNIKTDFRYWVRFSQLINDKNLSEEDYSFLVFGLYEDAIPENLEAGFEELKKFYAPAKELPRNIYNDGNTDVVLDYTIDGDLIYSAFLECYDLDLLDEKVRLHWWKFLALLDGLHGTKLNDVISFRCYNPNDKTKYEEYQRRMKAIWELPQNRELSESTKEWNSLFSSKK